MANPFPAFAFAATGEPTSRTLPDRLAEIKNVKDFGAKGDGVTDDWAAIMAAFNWTVSGNRGTIFFPPGIYVVSQAIDFSIPNINVAFVGVPGATVTVNFSDYVFKRGPDGAAGTAGVHIIENLTIINTNATGGAIRMGQCVGAAIRNCVITANLGINTSVADGSTDQSSLSVSIENCTLSPGANPSGSIGLMLLANGPVIGCHVKGYAIGVETWGPEGATNILGCTFELCGIGYKPGVTPTGASTSSGITLSGCLFKNCGTAIGGSVANACFSGIRIEGDTGTIAGDPQYGINISAGVCVFAGVVVTGKFQQYGISLAADANARSKSTFFGVQVTNSVGLGNWNVGSPAGSQFIGCNYAPVATVATLPAFQIAINTLSWSGGTTRASLFFNISNFTGLMTITVEGATPSGYNGTFTSGVTWPVTSASWSGTPGGSGTATITVTGLTVNGSVTLTVSGITPAGFNGRFSASANSGTNTITYTVNDPGSPTGTGGNVTADVSGNDVFYSQSNPGSPTGSGGTAVINYNGNELEGDCFNVSDSNVSTWGANPIGGGSTHAKVRWNGSNWTVMGK